MSVTTGALQGLDKKATAEQYGDEQVHIWRRSYDISPPDLDPKDPNSSHNDRRYANTHLMSYQTQKT